MYEIEGTNFIAMDQDEFLEHYGVGGMRWGHRKSKFGSQSKDGSFKNLKKAQKKYDKKANSAKVYVKAWNSAANEAEKKGGLLDQTNSKLEDLYKSYERKGRKREEAFDGPEAQDLMEEYDKVFSQIRDTKVSDILGPRPSKASNTRLNRKNHLA